MAYDAARGEVVLFGGLSSSGADGRTWLRRDGRWREADADDGPAPRTGAAMAFDRDRGVTVLFGGHVVGGSRGNETWEWDGEGWRQIETPEAPTARSFPSMAYDRARGEMVLFGGILDGGGSGGDTWTYDGATWTQEQPAASPPPRDSAALAYDAVRDEAVLFGGYGGGVRDDTWVWDGETWIERAPATRPAGRNSAAMAYDATREEVVLFGGIDNATNRNDTWTWNGQDWVERTAATAPLPRSASAAAFDERDDRVVLFGGSSANLDRSDTWLWDGETWASPDPPTPEARFGAGMAYDATRAEVLLYGGSVDQGLADDTWTWDGEWRREEPASNPGRRQYPAMVYDARRGEVVLFGGWGPGATELGDTWVWDGQTWEERTPLLSPPARHNHVMAYDAARRKVVLFGGSNRDLGLVFNDTWTWNGAEWSLELPETSPPPRSSAAMAHDPLRAQTVLFGGYNEQTQYTNDTWVWDGYTWTERSAADPPAPRAAPSMTYDAALGAVFLFGGNEGLGDHLDDAWLWNGQDWAALDQDTAPPKRWGAALAHHQEMGATVVFGGNTNTFLDDTWTWRLDSRPGGPPQARTRWTRPGLGLVNDLALADLDEDGTNEVVVGGLGVGAVDDDARKRGRYRWANKWPDGDDPLRDGDRDTVHDLEMADVTGDGIPDALVGASQAVFAFDGATGDTLWRIDNELGSGGTLELALGDFTGDGVPEVVHQAFIDSSIRAVDGRTGRLVWKTPRLPGFAAQIGVTDLNGDGIPDVLAIGAGEFGPDVYALNGAAAGATGVAVPLWAQKLPGGDPTVFRVGDLLSGGGREIAVGGYHGDLGVLDAATGVPLATWKTGGRVGDLALADLDGDADLEVVAATGYNDDNGDSTAVDAFQPTGQALWSYQASAPPLLLDLMDLDQDSEPELVVAGGWYEFRGHDPLDGLVAALDLAAGQAPEVLWEERVPTRVGSLTHGEALGEDVIVIGEDVDGAVRAFDEKGRERWTVRTGGHIFDLAAADLDGDGKPEILEGADDATVAVHGPTGDTRWHRRVPGSATPDVMAVTAGELTDDPGLEVAVGTWQYARGEGGSLRLYTADGEELWDRDTAGPFGTVLVEDLDRDGRRELLAGSTGPGLSGEGALLALYRGDGSVVWETATPPSTFGMEIGTTDLDDDGVLDVVVGTRPFGQAYVLGYDGRTGEEQWRFATDTILQWMDVAPAAADGIALGETGGAVRRLDRGGQEVWSVSVESIARKGGWSVMADDDGVPDVITTTDAGLVHMLSGATGEEIWSSPLDPEDRAYAATTILGSPVGNRVAVGSSSNTNGQRGGVYFFDPVTGTRTGKTRTEFHVADILAADLDGDGFMEAVAAAGWQIHAIDLSASG